MQALFRGRKIKFVTIRNPIVERERRTGSEACDVTRYGVRHCPPADIHMTIDRCLGFRERGCPTSGVAQGSLIESGVLLTRRPQEKTSVRILAEVKTSILIQGPCGAAFIRGNDVRP
jgi:hypothetical protein